MNIHQISVFLENRTGQLAEITRLLADNGIESVTVIVDSGDTLWDICSIYVPENMDIRDFIAKVKYVNKLPSSNLEIGTELVIPVR